jgi:hypothetical protein
MKKILVRPLLVLGNIAVTIAGALGLVRFVDTLPMNMPYGVDMFIRAILRICGHTELANPDDMEVLALLLYLFVSLVLVGAGVLLCNIALRRYFIRS